MKVERPYQLHEQDLDFSGTLRPASLMNTLLETSGMGADRCGFGIRDVLPMGYTWVLSRLSVQIDCAPAIGTKGRISTWVHDCEGIATTRYIHFCDEAGKDIARCVTNWALIDLKTRRPVHLEQLPRLKECTESETLDIDTIRVESLTEGRLFQHTVGYSDIDFNRHANSIRYLEWILNTCDRAFWESHRLQRLDINYLREGHWEDTVDITRQRENTYDLFDLSIGGKSICKARLTWQPLQQE